MWRDSLGKGFVSIKFDIDEEEDHLIAEIMKIYNATNWDDKGN